MRHIKKETSQNMKNFLSKALMLYAFNFKHIAFRLLLNTCYIRLTSSCNVTYKENSNKKLFLASNFSFYDIFYIKIENYIC